MEIEAEAAFGMQYSVWIESHDRASESGERGTADTILEIPVPYHGQICIATSGAGTLSMIKDLVR